MTAPNALTPPHDDAAEQAVLGAVFLDPTVASRAIGLLTPDQFHAENNRLIFGAIADLTTRGVTIDPLTIRDELSRRGNLDRAGGMEYVATLIDVVPTAANIEHHAAIVADKASRRRLADAARQLIDAVHNGLPLDGATSAFSAIIATVKSRASGVKAWRSLRDILTDPQASASPLAVVPRIAWKGRVSLFAGREKLGKSTFTAAGVAAMTQGRPFLGEPIVMGKALWLVAEEHPFDLAQRAKDFGTNEDNLFVMSCPPPERLFADLRAAVEAVKPALLVIDTLATAVGGLVEDPHSSTAWTPVMSAFTSIARDFDVGLLLLAHARKSDGAYRDSTAIGAGCDCILEMGGLVDDATARTIRARGRWAMQPFSVRFTGSGFDLSGGELSLDARVLLHIEQRPGLSLRGLRDSVQGRAGDVDAALRGLLQRGAVVERPGPRGAKLLFTPKDAPELDLTVSEPDGPDEVRDTVSTVSTDRVPTLSRNDLGPDTVPTVSQPKTLGGENGTRSAAPSCSKCGSLKVAVGSGWVCGTCYPAAVSPKAAA